MKVIKKNNIFISSSISSTEDEIFIQNNPCLKLETFNDTIDIIGNNNNININIQFDISEESQILEPAIKNIFKKMFIRLKEYVETL
jgi:hypothetical protein